jgi:uncharacterized protein YndB with AHSA1/START domain
LLIIGERLIIHPRPTKGGGEMAHVEKSIVINEPIEKVFDYAAEPNNWPKYIRNCIEIWERTEGPVAVGTICREKSALPGGMKSKCTNKVTEYNRPRKLVIETTNGIHLTIVYKLESKNGGTLFTMSGDWTMGGKFLTIVLDKLFIGRFVVRNFEDSVESLKKLVESE